MSQKNILILCCQDSYQAYLEFFLQNSLLLSDTEHAVLDDLLIIQIKGGTKDNSVHVALCLIHTAKRGVCSKSNVHGSVNFFIFKNNSV